MWIPFTCLPAGQVNPTYPSGAIEDGLLKSHQPSALRTGGYDFGSNNIIRSSWKRSQQAGSRIIETQRVEPGAAIVNEVLVDLLHPNQVVDTHPVGVRVDQVSLTRQGDNPLRGKLVRWTGSKQPVAGPGQPSGQLVPDA